MAPHRARAARILVEAPITPSWWRRSALNRVRADDHGLWHFRTRNGDWLTLLPDRIDMGPGGLWLSFSGKHEDDASPRALWAGDCTGGRVRFTLWRADADSDAWRRLRVAAQWCTHSVAITQGELAQ